MTGTERHGKHYVFLWLTVACDVTSSMYNSINSSWRQVVSDISLDTVAGQNTELSYTQIICLFIVIAVLVTILSGWVGYGVAITAAAT
jgi:hypothetical protein